MLSPRVLIITGSLNDVPKQRLIPAALTHLKLTKREKSKWLSLKIKLTFAENLVAKAIYGKQAMKYLDKASYTLLKQQQKLSESNLTADTIAHYLKQTGIIYQHCSLADIFYHKKFRKKILNQYSYIFLSTTFIHDLNELNCILELIKTKSNRIVIGGALTGSLLNSWQGDPRVKLVAVGYGEYLIPIIADWIRTQETVLGKPERGYILSKKHSLFLVSGSPPTKDLDFIEAPIPLHLKKDECCDVIYYESVRGCPFRCSFCNYPYLFDDNKFRYKSAEKIVNDWLWYKDTFKTKTIVVLDSLFTVPKARLEKVSNQLIEKQAGLEWVCYARANDLCDIEYMKKLKMAGLKQIHIGLESGNQNILDNMNKKTTVKQNIVAVQNCRQVGITIVASVIIGFPGETAASVEDTYQMLAMAKPDFCFVVVFSTRVPDVPILSLTERTRFNLKSEVTSFSMAPYWIHSTMSCLEACDYARAMIMRLVTNKICLDPMLFHEKINDYQPEMNSSLLAYQSHLYRKNKLINYFFNRCHYFINRKLKVPLQAMLEQSL